jgi:hypothetical protein
VRRALFLTMSACLLFAACGGGPTEPVRGGGVGARAPEFRLATPQGETIALADYRNKRDVLLYFSMGPG